jgi:dolichol-phosphate mannosyltransferase
VATLLSIICPVHNEALCVPLFYERLMTALEPLKDAIDIELIFMNNRSTDGTSGEVLRLRGRDPRVQLLTLAKNVGYQASVQTGLRRAAGDALVVIDVDCEDPPELIPVFVEEWRRGADIVYGERKNRPEPGWLTGLRRLFYRLNRLIADSDIILDMAEFCLMTSAVRDAVLDNRSTFPFVRADVAAAGFARTGIPYDRGPRIAGESHYSLRRMTVFAVAGILSSTTFPLRAALYALAVVLPANITWFVARAFGTETGFQAVVVLDLLYLCTFLAFACLYLARTYRNGIGRPVAIIDWRASASDLHVSKGRNS